MEALKSHGADHVLVVCGGIIPEADIPKLTEIGVAKVFTPGSRLQDILEWLAAELDRRETAAESTQS
jgi:methylmalonyl-CoA mutase C-terminal domain/subunit